MPKLRRLLDWMEPSVRLILGVGIAAGSLYPLSHGAVYGGLGPLVGGGLVWDAIRNASVWSAFRAFRAGRIEGVRWETKRVYWPRLLSPTARAYYHWLRGVVESADGRWAAARVHLLVAATGRLQTANDRALVQCLLAEAALQSGKPPVAAEHVRMATALAGDSAIKPMTEKLSGRIAAASGE